MARLSLKSTRRRSPSFYEGIFDEEELLRLERFMNEDMDVHRDDRKSLLKENSCQAICPVCICQYDDCVHIPKFLSCHHTICVKCISKLEIVSRIKCPVCRSNTNLPSGGAAGLQTNFYITSNAEEGCTKHSNQPFHFYCKTHQSLVCQSCTVLEHSPTPRDGQKPCLLQDKAELKQEIRIELETKQQEVCKAKDTFHSIQNKTTDQIQQLKDMREQQICSVKKTFDGYVKYVEKCREEACQNIETEYSIKLNQLQTAKTDAGKLEKKMESHLEKIKGVLEKDKIQNLLLEKKQLAHISSKNHEIERLEAVTKGVAALHYTPAYASEDELKKHFSPVGKIQ
ncbi:tripartite motif-containing protein 2-like [Lingula anatina]|uniref:Tripartite motif-containing protein 2-like n=1 Tax=Lingula anatina TaxID=7574 RepID=A0A1S3H1G9_LINAN|nr:tripartite motif-containing protein 2-like [Lingula anatina]|eukprot:XP_013379326.1 tripartite motif-containing protein 2-like [Lingula anatina]